ncbi:hypothetical protein Poli38472_013621 [Pythium oligandrum]|uniref:t-SNARE coiled-coil homology domain-containing protein n=1 Tax=Pythium oligandrum TaxID=41045 RepID=A0A8K1CDS8_PYTOL|nr:hypothetical protein Poli38472_013621 [Pythium oligandrum]|eukprot:TMW61158.1 hypothetical protein Poli38472_013621 [Pythium oligandrum]
MYREKSDSGEYNTDYQAMSAQQMEQHRQDEFDRQDAMLDNIHRGVKGLKNHAHAINDEVVRQNHEIDDISNRMDDAQDDLERGEANAREVNRRKAKTCKLYGVIGVLVVVEIVLSFV